MDGVVTLDMDLRNDLEITSIQTYIVDLPMKRAHQHSTFDMRKQTYLVVGIETNHGLMGYGEAATAGGPWWSGDSIETIKIIIDRYFSPAIVGKNPLKVNVLKDIMDKVAARNGFAKATIEMALLDLKGKAYGVPVYALFGGARRTKFEVSWPLGIGDFGAEIEEAKGMMAEKLACRFKVKMGNLSPEEDMQRLTEICKEIGSVATVTVDINGAWDEMTFSRMSAQFDDLGILAIEQPLPAETGNLSVGLKNKTLATIMADESLYGPSDALQLSGTSAVGAFSIKLMKAGGFSESITIAEIAEAKGIACFGGCFLEGGLGTLANMHIGAVVKQLSLGCEWVGPLLLTDSVYDDQILYSDYCVHLPDKTTGFGVSIIQEKLMEYARKD